MHFSLKIFFVILLSLQFSYAQDKGSYMNSVAIAIPDTGSSEANISLPTPCFNFLVKEGKAWIKIDLGENYELGSSTKGTPFQITAALDLKVVTSDPANSPSISFDIEINNNKPEAIVYLDLAQYIDATNQVTGFSYNTLEVSEIEATLSNFTATDAALLNNVRATLNYDISFGVDVQNQQVNNLTNTPIANSKTIIFNWGDTCNAPSYEFQILRLYNKSESTITREEEITTDIDWSKALSIFIEKSVNAFDLTIGEGQGFYIWRVRPIGTYFENEIGNNKNWGNWNTYDFPDCNNCVFNIDSLTSNQVFFFYDPDDNKNFQYSRVFTEDNKISEQITYATTLNQVRQTQRYLPSKDYKVVTQTILDNSGRPTLNTLPIPFENERISAYKENFVTSNNELYKATQFDTEDNYNNPSVIDATGAFTYYSNLNSDQRIPDAQGFPFTRTIFTNDGTDRVTEQSGVGKEHMIGQQADGNTRTTRTFYSTASEGELEKLFGDEAPNHQDVAKVITVDPNNTRSVSYITKEGNTIATGITFSEDEGVLDNVKNSNQTIDFKEDSFSNNILSNEGFTASKRITILKEDTQLELSYNIKKNVLDGLCNDFNIDINYDLKVEVFDASTGEALHTFTDKVENNITEDLIVKNFGSISLPIGSYYIQKTLSVDESVAIGVEKGADNASRIINPFTKWLSKSADKVDCEKEMNYLYHDIFEFGKRVFNNSLASDIIIQTDGQKVASVKLECIGCSQEEITFKSKKDPSVEDEEPADEFLDYYIGHEEEYGLDVFYVDAQGDTQLIDYRTQNNLSGIKPVQVIFRTPCCIIEVPVVFTPPFKTPPLSALQMYRADQSILFQAEESADYFAGGTSSFSFSNNDNSINPNPAYLTDGANNFTYVEDEEGEATALDNTKAYALDLEGYAISMLYECQNTIDPNYTRETAAETIYSYMRGWHRPGVFNQMVHHMVFDKAKGECSISERQKGENTLQSGSSKYDTCNTQDNGKKFDDAIYDAQNLVDCWESLVIEIIERECVGNLEINGVNGGVVGEEYDNRGGNSRNELRSGIRSFILRLLSGRKIRRLIRRVRNQNISGDGNVGSSAAAEDEATEEIDNLVKTFLECSGYAFQYIVDRNKTKAETRAEITEIATEKNKPELLELIKDFEEDKRYNRLRLIPPGRPNDTIWNRFTLRGKIDTDGDYINVVNNLPEDEIDPSKFLAIEKFFGPIFDPVYAFKYFEYEDGTFPILEAETCYRDPNICIDISIDPITGEPKREEFGCCGEDAQGNPIPCNFCNTGFLVCEETKDDWDCDQNFTFHGLIKSYREEEVGTNPPVSCENYYEAEEYYRNPELDLPDDIAESDYILNFTPESELTPGTLSSFEFITNRMFVGYPGGFITNSPSEFERVTTFKNIKGEVQETGVSLAEHEARLLFEECEGRCDERRDEFKRILIQSLEDRCYVIGDCKVATNDNIIPEGDIDILVDEIVTQCLKQCEIDTYACIDESCRALGAPTKVVRDNPLSIQSFFLNVSFADYGVSGPILDGRSNRNENLKFYDPLNNDRVETSIAPTITENANGFKKYDYERTQFPQLKIWDIRQSLTYAQSTRNLQAREWTPVFDLPAKCDDRGIYNPNLTYDDDNLPEQQVYYIKDGRIVAQQLKFEICTDQDEYITRENSTGAGDTFIERDEYVRNANAPVTADSFSKSPTSGKTGINVKVAPKNP